MAEKLQVFQLILHSRGWQHKTQMWELLELSHIVLESGSRFSTVVKLVTKFTPGNATTIKSQC